MEIRELDLAAFGPFTDRVLAFGNAPGGLHIVYGPNEAGKSSALRGLRALLYGIPSRTTDNFLHDNARLRIGGRLQEASGRELAFVRRKGRKNTLLSPAGDPLDAAALTPFTLGVTEEVFVTLFGIDHNALVRGGREILEQKGEVGQALFAASLGSTALHEVLEALDREADELFKPRGSTQAINAALKEHANLNREIRDISLSSRDWDERHRALARTTRELEQLQAELVRDRAEVNRLRRIQRALPKLTRRRDLQQHLAALGEVVVLPQDFGKRRQAAVGGLDKAGAMATQAASLLQRHEEQLAGLSVRCEVLELGESIEALHARLGSHRKAMEDRPHLEAERSQLQAAAESLLRDVRPGLALADVETLRPVLKRRVRITELGNRHQALTERVAQTRITLQETEVQLEQERRARGELPEAGSPDALRQAVTAARKAGDLDEVLRTTRGELHTVQEQCRHELARLAPWRGALEAVSALPVPARASIDRFEQAYEEHDKQVQRLRDRQGEANNTLHDAQRRLDELDRAGAVPTEQDLTDTRAERDLAWALLRRQWIDGEDISAEATALDAGRALPEAFESRLAAADEVVDRLRREADRVHQQASLQAEAESARQRSGELGQTLDECAGRKQRLDAEWGALWKPCAVQPRTPREMRAWLDSLDRLKERVGHLNSLVQRAGELEHNRDAHIGSLQEQLRALGREPVASRSLEGELVESEAVAAAIEDLQRRRAVLDKDIKTLERNLEQARIRHQAARSEYDAWKAQWDETVADLDVGADALPAEVAAVIEKLGELFARLEDAGKLRIRIKSIDEDAGAFHDQVKHVVASVAAELADLPAEDAVVRLNRLLADNRDQESTRQQVAKQIQLAQQDIQDAESLRQTLIARLDALGAEARCENHAGLEAAERRSAEHLELKSRITAIESELLEIGEGATLERLEQEAGEVDPDALPGRIELLTGKIDAELEPRRTGLAETRGRELTQLAQMDGGDAAAALAEEAQSLLTGIRSHAEQYVRLKLAARILRAEIERYRMENQGPLVLRASEHFAVLTRGSFQSLRADFNEKDEPVLVGVRPSGASVQVDGMSSGTRDQLYLALRLASLEKYMESAEPMPFIVDDILVHFDDERSKATLGVLAELARKTQVILFTHHARLVEQARALNDGAHVMVHEL